MRFRFLRVAGSDAFMQSIDADVNVWLEGDRRRALHFSEDLIECASVNELSLLKAVRLRVRVLWRVVL